MATEPKYNATTNGQEFQIADANLIGQEAALAEDRVLAELLRLPPNIGGAVKKAVLPFAHLASIVAMIAPNGATGQVTVSPFLAIVGSRTNASSDAIAALRDQRSQTYVGSATSLTGTASFGANSSGQPRWDLLCAVVAVDANGPSVIRYIKDPTTKVVTGTSIVTTLVTSVTLQVVPGTAAASPDPPATPSDGGGNYYIPLALVRIPNGFNGSSTVLKSDIATIAPIVPISRASGVATMQPADQQFTIGGSAITAARVEAWGAAAPVKPGYFVPAVMVGAESVFVDVDLTSASSANWSHASGAVIDASRDWSNRWFEWHLFVRDGATTYFPWDPQASRDDTLVPQGSLGVAMGVRSALGFGQSLLDDMHAVLGNGAALVGYLDPAVVSAMASSTKIYIWVDRADSGKLKISVVGAPLVKLFGRITASAPYPNPGA